MKLYTSDYARVDYSPDSSLLETVWMPRSSELNREWVIKEMQNFLSLAREKRPHCMIADTRYFGFKVDQELQQWIILHYISEIIDCGVIHYAILVTEEKFPELSKINLKDDSQEDFHVKYFTSHAEAFRWVTSRK
jgi:hypothetical protein